MKVGVVVVFFMILVAAIVATSSWKPTTEKDERLKRGLVPGLIVATLVLVVTCIIIARNSADAQHILHRATLGLFGRRIESDPMMRQKEGYWPTQEEAGDAGEGAGEGDLEKEFKVIKGELAPDVVQAHNNMDNNTEIIKTYRGYLLPHPLGTHRNS